MNGLTVIQAKASRIPIADVDFDALGRCCANCFQAKVSPHTNGEKYHCAAGRHKSGAGDPPRRYLSARGVLALPMTRETNCGDFEGF